MHSDRTLDYEKARKHALERCRERKVLIPKLSQMNDPVSVDASIKQKLLNVDIQDVHPLNLFRITWYNDPQTGGFKDTPNFLEIPSEVSGVRARIIGLLGKHFPTGAHKVGAAFGCLVPRLVSGGFDPTTQKAVWPSTGNYCRGGAFDSALLGCKAVAILPKEMSRERFKWLESIGAEIIATPGCESNVKEIFDACWDIKKNQKDSIIFNQFEEFGNYLWHYGVTARAAETAFKKIRKPKSRFSGWVGATGSAGTLATGDYLKEAFPGLVITAAEALQCPTLLRIGFGGHRIEGIGDKHIPWIHNIRNTDLITAIDDEQVMRLFRLFNEPAGHELLIERGVSDDLVQKLPSMGISSICNMLAAIKTARYYEMTEDDLIFTCFTDSAAMYQTRLSEMTGQYGAYHERAAMVDFERCLLGATTDHLRELNYLDRKALHNFKYFTWVEQQGRTIEDLNRLWEPSFWKDLGSEIPRWDQEIETFNRDSGVLELIKKGA